MTVTLLAPAKVNLYLKVVGRREDGFHLINTLMQPVSLADELDISLTGSGLSLACDDPSLQDENLVLEAARAFFERTGLPARASFHLRKHIPVAAGLGGGSSDAAAALKGLNRLHDHPLAEEELAELAAGLGADVPFFLAGCTAWCTGIGEVVEPWPDFPLLELVLVNPGFSVSTAWVYGQLDLEWTNSALLHRIYRPPRQPEYIERLLANDLERVTLQAHPVVGQIKAALMEKGAEGTLMTGSGPTVLGVFPDRVSAVSAAEQLMTMDRWWVRSCGGIGVLRHG